MRHGMVLAIVAVLLLLAAASAQTVTTFEGIDASAFRGATLGVDPNGAIGTKQYLEWANTVYQGFDKVTGKSVTSITAGDTPWVENGMPDCEGSSGNVEILFDRMASRWVIGRRQGRGTFFYCIAVSNTDDLTSPTFAWYTYELPLNSILGNCPSGSQCYPDYPKIGTWSDGYYVAIDMEDTGNGFQQAGVLACAFDRTTMLTGGTMRTPQCFRVPGNEPYPSHSLEPADIDGVNAPPVGQPEYFASMENPAQGQTQANFLNEWVFHVDWNTPSNSYFHGPSKFTVNSYTQGCFTPSNPENTICVPEPSSQQTGQLIDSVGDRLMERFAYRRFLGTTPYQSWLVSATVQVGSAVESQTGVQWWEYRDKGSGHFGTVTFNDGNYRFMPSIAEDQTARMAVGYSISGATMHPSIAAAYLNLNKVGPPKEIMLWSGAADEENSYHWGVYSSMTVDPIDNCTFWYVNEYFGQNQIGSEINWQTRLSNFKLPTCP